jgi:hypothetical protein
MSKSDLAGTKATLTGTYYLLDPDAVLDIYEKAGKDPDATEDSKQPDYVETVDGCSYLFTGWTVNRKGEDYEFVIKLSDEFTKEEIDSIDFMQPDETDEEE